MPYIANSERRDQLDDGLEAPLNVGELNFKITKIISLKWSIFYM